MRYLGLGMAVLVIAVSLWRGKRTPAHPTMPEVFNALDEAARRRA